MGPVPFRDSCHGIIYQIIFGNTLQIKKEFYADSSLTILVVCLFKDLKISINSTALPEKLKSIITFTGTLRKKPVFD